MSNEKILVDALAECMVQIQYLHEKFGETGSGNAVLAKGKQAISDYSLAQQKRDEDVENLANAIFTQVCVSPETFSYNKAKEIIKGYKAAIQSGWISVEEYEHATNHIGELHEQIKEMENEIRELNRYQE